MPHIVVMAKQLSRRGFVAPKVSVFCKYVVYHNCKRFGLKFETMWPVSALDYSNIDNANYVVV